MYGCRSNILSTHNIFCIRITLKIWKYKDVLHQILLGFKRAYDSVMCEVLTNSVIECVMNMKLVILTKIY
jgi:hypothetical protein